MVIRGGHPAQLFLLVLTVVFTAGAIILLSRQSTVLAQPVPQQAAEMDDTGILVTPFQLTPGRDGLAIVDRQNSTICIYQYQPHRPRTTPTYMTGCARHRACERHRNLCGGELRVAGQSMRKLNA